MVTERRCKPKRSCTRLKCLLPEESPSCWTETGTCALSLPGLQVSAGEGREGDPARCFCSLAKCCKNFGKCEYLSCVLNRKQISHCLCTRKQVSLSPCSRETSCIAGFTNSQELQAFSFSSLLSFSCCRMKHVIYECMPLIPSFGISFSVNGRGGICVLTMPWTELLLLIIKS